jgi:hypothetical protein
MQEKQNVSSNTVSTTDPEEPYFGSSGIAVGDRYS